MSADRVVLWRHGQTASNAEGRWQGQLDVPLDDTGREQAERAAVVLAKLAPAAIVSSDLSRASGTAAALGRATGLDVVLDEGLREVYAGRWQGLTRQEVEDRWPGDLVRWASGEDERHGGGERRSEVAVRAGDAIERHTRALDGGVLVVVAHGGALRSAVGRLLGFPPEVTAPFGVLHNAHWGVLVPGRKGWFVERWNVGADG